jgi:inosine-uridine nucleoside N-ribohydrolase
MDPVSHEFPESWRQAADDFWGLSLPEKVTEVEVGVGPEMIVDLVNRSPRKVTLVGMASMIDIAQALQMDPGIIDNISHVIIMGGAFTVPGNLNEGPEPTNNVVAEWNIWIDAEAAKYLFNSGVPLSIVPLDGIQYFVTREDVNTVNAINDPGVNYVAWMWNQQLEWFGEFFIWDMITATAVTNPENFFWTVDGVDVITEPGDFQGQTVALNNGAQHTRYATGGDYDAIMQQIFETYGGEQPAAATILGGDDSAGAEPESAVVELGGTWEGETEAFHITFILQDTCMLNVKCGTFEIPDFSLTGDITFVRVDGHVYEFNATNLSSGVPSAAEYEYLELLDDGTLKYVTMGGSTVNQAILYRR